MEKAKLQEILEKHAKWLRSEEGGERADLSGAILSGANLSWANLSGANLSGANLSGADLSRADLFGADLSRANLSGADLSWANLSGADLSGANLSGADLSGADLSRANLSWAILSRADLSGADLSRANLSGANLSWANNVNTVRWDEMTAFFSIVCPEEGSFIGWKVADGHIVKLRITDDAKRSSATARKCRCSKAEVVSIENMDGTPFDDIQVRSDHDHSFIYRIGEIVEVPDFDDDRWNECSRGIHFFITRQEAVNYGNR